MRYECQEMFTHKVIATFDTYEEADYFIDASADYPDWWAVPPIMIVEVTDDAEES